MVRYSKFKKRTFKKKYNAKALIRREIDKRLELKTVANTLSADFESVSNDWAEVTTSAPAQGTSETQRIGRRISLRSIEIRGVLASGASEAALDDAYNVVRIIIALWNGSSESPLDEIVLPMDSILQKDLNSRGLLIRKYYDKYIPLPITSTEKGGGDGYTPSVKRFNYYKRFKKPIDIDFGDDTIAYPNKRLVISMVSDSTASPNPGFVNGYWAVKYTDA